MWMPHIYVDVIRNYSRQIQSWIHIFMDDMSRHRIRHLEINITQAHNSDCVCLFPVNFNHPRIIFR